VISTRTLYRKKRIELIDRMLLDILKLARLGSCQELEDLPLPTLSFISRILENPRMSLGEIKKQLRAGSHGSDRKSSLMHQIKKIHARPGIQEIKG